MQVFFLQRMSLFCSRFHTDSCDTAKTVQETAVKLVLGLGVGLDFGIYLLTTVLKIKDSARGVLPPKNTSSMDAP